MNKVAQQPISRFSVGEAELHDEFTLIDGNGDNKIDCREFRTLMTDLDAKMSDQDIQIGFHEIDTDKDGFIDRSEFMEWWLND